jgi:hypothetical protein
MPHSDLPGLRPARGYDELLATSMARGRVLRRRRHVLQSTPFAAVLAGVVAVTFSAGPGGPHGLERLKTTDTPASSPTPTAVAPVLPTPRPNVAQPAAHAPAPVVPAGRPERPVSATQAPATRDQAGKPAPTHGLTVIPQVLDFADPTGDATAQGAPVSAASDPALDITGMRFETTQDGLRVSMRVAGAYSTNGGYDAYLTDARTGWQIQLVLGGYYRDYAYAVQWSPAGTVANEIYIALPFTPEPSSQELVAVIPWQSFPSVVSPRDRFTTISGQTRQMTPTGNGVVADNAPTSSDFGPMVR